MMLILHVRWYEKVFTFLKKRWYSHDHGWSLYRQTDTLNVNNRKRPDACWCCNDFEFRTYGYLLLKSLLLPKGMRFLSIYFIFFIAHIAGNLRWTQMAYMFSMMRKTSRISLKTHQSRKKRKKIGVQSFLLILFLPILVVLVLLSSRLVLIANSSSSSISIGNYHHDNLSNHKIKQQEWQDQQYLTTTVGYGGKVQQVMKESTASRNLFHFIISSDCTSYQRWEVLT